jgi:anti-sigma28 factor (negative regulator of flagellin synthesis)
MYGNRPFKKMQICEGNVYVDVKKVGDKLINDRR